jgi:hypothetical protein
VGPHGPDDGGAGASQRRRGVAGRGAQAIADWNYALRQEFGGLITLTDVTDQYTAKHKADIVVHYNPTAGGRDGVRREGDLWGKQVSERHRALGSAAAGRVHVPAAVPVYVTMHELGHALGLGHAQPLTESTDLMGYGWHWSNGIVPTLSECDLAGIAIVFAWALHGVDPYPPTQPSVASENLP